MQEYKVGQLISTNLGLIDVSEVHEDYIIGGCLANGRIYKLYLNGTVEVISAR